MTVAADNMGETTYNTDIRNMLSYHMTIYFQLN